MDDANTDGPQPEVPPVALPPVPMWPIWVGVVIALVGAVLFVMHPTDPMFWIAQLGFGLPLLIAWDWRWERAKKLGYAEPKGSGSPDADFGGMWGPP